MRWNGRANIGSVVYYQCEEGYHTRSLRNYSVCGESGLWEDIELSCEGAMFLMTDMYIDNLQFSIQNICSNLEKIFQAVPLCLGEYTKSLVLHLFFSCH